MIIASTGRFVNADIARVNPTEADRRESLRSIPPPPESVEGGAHAPFDPA
jgi:hypothetical protein